MDWLGGWVGYLPGDVLRAPDGANNILPFESLELEDPVLCGFAFIGWHKF